MLNKTLNLNEDVFLQDKELKSERDAFGEAILKLGEDHDNVVVLTADLEESLRLTPFRKKFPDRFIETGIAEQNMASIGTGMALSGLVPFISSHAVFSPYRNWDQIRLSICFSNANVKIVGSHAGFSNSPDGGAVSFAGSPDFTVRKRFASSIERLPRPTSAMTPTIRRTIFQIKCEPPIRMRIRSPSSFISIR